MSDVTVRRADLPDGDRYYPCQTDGENVPGKTNVIWSAGVPWVVVEGDDEKFVARSPIGGPVMDVTGGRAG